MSPLHAIVFGLCVAAVVALTVWMLSRDFFFDAFAMLAPRVGGMVVRAHRFALPALRWDEDGTPAEMNPLAGGVAFSFRWVPSGRLLVVTEASLEARWNRFLSLQDIQLDDRSFNQRFMVRGEPMAWARSLWHTDSGASTPCRSPRPASSEP